MKNKDAVSQAIVKLFETERFYAELISQMRRIESKRIPTAGVRIKDQIELFINPDFFQKLTLEERVAILKHECEHVLRDHISRCRELAPDVYDNTKKSNEVSLMDQMKHQSLNIAADCAINYNLKNLPEGGVYPKSFDLPDDKTMEWYLENLKDNEKAKQFMEFDDHSLWAESDGEKEVLKEKIRQAVNKAANKTRAAGLMTANDEFVVSQLNNKNMINWKDVLRRFVAKTIQSTIEVSRKKRNRRYGIMFPGNIKVEELHLGVAIDTSGSVSDESLSQFMAEIEQISKYAKITVAEVDSEIKKSYIFKKNKEYKVSGRGGTAYQPAFDFFAKEDIDALIYFGDMDSSDEPKKPKYPVLWAIIGEQDPPANFGAKLRIEL
jgi:predicted metal-dependent peptidase